MSRGLQYRATDRLILRDMLHTHRLLTVLGAALLLLAAGWGEARAHSSHSGSRASVVDTGSRHHAAAAHTSGTALSHAIYLPAERSSLPVQKGHCPSRLSLTCGPLPAVVPTGVISLPEPNGQFLTGREAKRPSPSHITHPGEKHTDWEQGVSLLPTRLRLWTRRFLI